MADEIVYKKVTRKANKCLEGKVVAKHGNYYMIAHADYAQAMRTYRGKTSDSPQS